MLLGEHGEDEVVVRDRQEALLPLGALHEPLAPEAAGPDRDPRLDLLVAGAERIARRVDERQDAALLVVLQGDVPHHRRGDDRHGEQDAGHLEPHARDKRHRQQHGHQRGGGPQIRLPRDEHQRERRERAADGQVAGVRGPAPAVAEQLGEDEGEADLHELGRLQVEEGQRNPAPSAAAHDSEEQHVHEQQR